MALVKTIAEDNGSYKSTWTLTIQTVALTATSSTISIPFPSSISAKYVGNTNKNSAGVHFHARIAGETVSANYAEYEKGGLGESWSSASLMKSGTTYTVSRTGGNSSISVNTSRFFTSSNPTDRTADVHWKLGTGSLESGYQPDLSSGTLTYYGYYTFPNNTWTGYIDNGLDIGTYATITLDAPPLTRIGTPTYTTPHYAGLGTYSVPLTTLIAQYGGNITSVTLTIGADSTTQTYSSSEVSDQTISVTPSVAGTYTPTITVTDSRGQVTTVQLSQITVNAYNAPSINFDVQRCTNISGHIGVPDVEGEKALVTANISYTKAIANLTQPTVLVQDSDGNTIASSATWYETWTAQDGVDDAVNWTNYNPSNPVTLYAVVSATNATLSQSESYSISITPADNRGGNAQTITQTLPTSFFTIDFQAGGKEIAFGAPANDDLTNYPPNCDTSDSGLFKCNMTVVSTQMVGEIKMWAGNNAPNGWLVCDGSAISRTAYPLLFDAIGTLWGAGDGSTTFNLPNLVGKVPVGYDSSQTEFNTVGKDGGEKTHLLTYQESGCPSHNHSQNGHTHTPYSTSYNFMVGTTAINRTRFKSGSDGNYCYQGAQAAMPAISNSTKTASTTATNIQNTATNASTAHNNLQPYAVVKYIICAI